VAGETQTTKQEIEYMKAVRKVVVPSPLAALIEVMKHQETKNPALAAKQRRLINILKQRRIAS
jgi:hypothetical protein